MNISYKLELSSKPKQDKTSLIMLRVTQNKKHKRTSSGIFVFAEDFNRTAEHGKWIRRSNPNYTKLNDELKKVIGKAEAAARKLENNKQPVSTSSLLAEYKHGNTESFLSYYNEKLTLFFDLHSISYYKHLKSKYNNLKKYLKKNDLLFSELNTSFLNKYEGHLKKEKLSDNSVKSNMKALRTILYEAIKEDRFNGENPFFLKYKIGQMKVNREKLSIENIKKIEGLKIEVNSALWHVRNYFLFSFYTAGIRHADFMQLQWNNIKENRLTYTMGKTDNKHSVLLLPKALKILDHYRNEEAKPTDYIFPLLENNLKKASRLHIHNQISSKQTVINRDLKKLQALAEIDTKIFFHLSRHSFANIMKDKISLHDIKDLLGHSDISITQRYVKSFDSEASDKALKKGMKALS